MNDLRLIWDTTLGEADLSAPQNSGDLEGDAGLETAVIISLLTDRRADDDDILPDPGNIDRRGWWGDLLGSDPVDDEIGSRLWVFTERGKLTESLISDVKNVIEEALQWMIDDGIATTIEVEVERVSNNIYYLVKIYKTEGNPTTYSVKYDSNWQVQISRI